MSNFHLILRKDTYYFRIKIPHDMVQHVNRREMWKSLKTNSVKTANVLVSKLLYKTEQLFVHVRSGMFTSEEIKKLVTDYLHRTLDRKERHRAIAPLPTQNAGRMPVLSEVEGLTLPACQAETS